MICSPTISFVTMLLILRNPKPLCQTANRHSRTAVFYDRNAQRFTITSETNLIVLSFGKTELLIVSTLQTNVYPLIINNIHIRRRCRVFASLAPLHERSHLLTYFVSFSSLQSRIVDVVVFRLHAADSENCCFISLPPN